MSSFQRSGSEKTYSLTTTFWLMAFMEPAYALDRYAGVTWGALFACSFFPFGSDDAAAKALDCLVAAALPLVVGRDDSQLLAWYKKFNLCIISLFGTLWGFGGALLCCFFAMEGGSSKSKAKFDDRPASIAVTEPQPQQQRSNGMVISIELFRSAIISYTRRMHMPPSYIC